MTRLRPIAGIASAAALTFTLAACSGGSDYCDAIEAANDKFGNLTDFDPTDTEELSDMQGAIADVASSAPDDVKDTWQNSADAFQALVDADGDPTAIDPELIERFSSMTEDMDTLQTQVKDECDIDLG